MPKKARLLLLCAIISLNSAMVLGRISNVRRSGNLFGSRQGKRSPIDGRTLRELRRKLRESEDLVQKLQKQLADCRRGSGGKPIAAGVSGLIEIRCRNRQDR